MLLNLIKLIGLELYRYCVHFNVQIPIFQTYISTVQAGFIVLNPFNPCFHVHDVRLFMALWIFSLIFKRWLLDIFCIFFCRCNYYQSLSYYVDFWNDGFSLLKPTQSVMFCLKIYFPEMFMWWCSFIFLLSIIYLSSYLWLFPDHILHK